MTLSTFFRGALVEFTPIPCDEFPVFVDVTLDGEPLGDLGVGDIAALNAAMLDAYAAHELNEATDRALDEARDGWPVGRR
jgi:hypothetical protein